MFGLKRFNMTIRVTNKQVRLDPPLQAYRRYWITKLNDVMGWVMKLAPISSNNGQRRPIDRAPETAGARCRLVVSSSPLQVIEQRIQRIMDYMDQWRRHQALWEMELAVLFGILGTDLEKWIDLLNEIRGDARTMMDTTETQSVVVGVTIDCREAQEKVSKKYDKMSEELIRKFCEILLTQMNATQKSMKGLSRADGEVQRSVLDG